MNAKAESCENNSGAEAVQISPFVSQVRCNLLGL